MVQVTANIAYDWRDFHFGDVVSFADSLTLSTIDLTIGSQTYEDTFTAVRTLAGAPSFFRFGGSDMVLSTFDQALTAGTVSAVVVTNHANDDLSAAIIFKDVTLTVSDLNSPSDPGDDEEGGSGGLFARFFAGNDRFVLSNFNDNSHGWAGNDLMYGLKGNDLLTGGTGDDKLYGGAGNDQISGGEGSDLIAGGLGKDQATYQSAAAGVTVDLSILVAQNTGGEGLDTLTGIENLRGSSYADRLLGNALDNRIEGGAGKDSLIGGAGKDTLDGGAGSDTLRGGIGADKFILALPDQAGEFDLITDFSAKQGDKIVFPAGLALAVKGALPADQFLAGAGATQAKDANDHLIYDTTTGNLYYDADGLGGDAAVKLAQFGATTHPVLAATDFAFVDNAPVYWI